MSELLQGINRQIPRAVSVQNRSPTVRQATALPIGDTLSLQQTTPASDTGPYSFTGSAGSNRSLQQEFSYAPAPEEDSSGITLESATSGSLPPTSLRIELPEPEVEPAAEPFFQPAELTFANPFIRETAEQEAIETEETVDEAPENRFEPEPRPLVDPEPAATSPRVFENEEGDRLQVQVADRETRLREALDRAYGNNSALESALDLVG